LRRCFSLETPVKRECFFVERDAPPCESLSLNGGYGSRRPPIPVNPDGTVNIFPRFAVYIKDAIFVAGRLRIDGAWKEAFYRIDVDKDYRGGPLFIEYYKTAREAGVPWNKSPNDIWSMNTMSAEQSTIHASIRLTWGVLSANTLNWYDRDSITRNFHGERPWDYPVSVYDSSDPFFGMDLTNVARLPDEIAIPLPVDFSTCDPDPMYRLSDFLNQIFPKKKRQREAMRDLKFNDDSDQIYVRDFLVPKGEVPVGAAYRVTTDCGESDGVKYKVNHYVIDAEMPDFDHVAVIMSKGDFTVIDLDGARYIVNRPMSWFLANEKQIIAEIDVTIQSNKYTRCDRYENIVYLDALTTEELVPAGDYDPGPHRDTVDVSRSYVSFYRSTGDDSFFCVMRRDSGEIVVTENANEKVWVMVDDALYCNLTDLLFYEIGTGEPVGG